MFKKRFVLEPFALSVFTLRITLFSLVCLSLLNVPVAFAGDYERDVNRAIDTLVREPDRAYKAYRAALESYRDKRSNAFECLLVQLRNPNPDTDISSNWDSCLSRINSAFATLKGDLLLAFKDATPNNDYSPDKIGVRDFMLAEEAFISAFQGKRVFPDARSPILNGVKFATKAIEDFDQKWNELSKTDSDLESKKAEKANTVKETAKTLRDALTKAPPGTVPTLIKIPLELSKYTDAFWSLVQTEKSAVFVVFRTHREIAQKLYNERIRPDVSESFLNDAKRAAESNSALTNREDYKTFAAQALGILSGYVQQERALSEEFLRRNKGRFIDAAESDVERLAGSATMKQYLVDMELEAKSLEELLVKYEREVSASAATSEVKSAWRDLKDSFLTAAIYNRWMKGYEEYRRSLEENGLKR